VKGRSFLVVLTVGLVATAGSCSSGGPGGSPSSPRVSPSASVQHAGLVSYTNTAQGFSIRYPQGWEKREGALGTAVLLLSPREGTSDEFQENVNVLVQKVPDKMSLEEYSKLSIEQAPKLITGFRLLDQGSTTLGESPAHRIHYRGEQGAFHLEWEQVWSVLEGQAFIITYTAERDRYQMYRPTAEAMIASFRLL
jgi:eukaryotic-like serine/threonine-protein kinase